MRANTMIATSAAAENHAIVRCPGCPTYRGVYRLVPFLDRLMETRAGHDVYRLPS